ncbi:glycerol-3-phosphate 1-O-acyltransferase PlsY [Silanimonas sp.]|uniref:glycerol-3-phosphate 1-O-acyltransferase PlsY n=1 Tax=Silanimonas sp. TaxID=1929290 RepID=UPI0022BE5D0B|nr:glycerol-3-phosphate 1-O-acyltransferase PlsY [Silanimonas sp.]MCZ8114173.1 glycerol-3-phosphate 1-O-acyltransferase PlsY [Silanimonas sp.]
MSLATMLAAGAAAYLLGSISGSLWLGKLRGVDIRTQGSGNAGGTNAFRTQGSAFALGTVLIDIGKGAAAVALMRWAGGDVVLQMLGALLAVAGHVWPVFHGFRGGKGAATLVGGLALLWPLALAPLLSVWLLVLLSTGYVGLATVLAGVALPLWALLEGRDGAWLGFAVAVAVLLAWTHRANLQRLRAGNEHRFEKARLLARLWARPDA